MIFKNISHKKVFKFKNIFFSFIILTFIFYNNLNHSSDVLNDREFLIPPFCCDSIDPLSYNSISSSDSSSKDELFIQGKDNNLNILKINNNTFKNINQKNDKNFQTKEKKKYIIHKNETHIYNKGEKKKKKNVSLQKILLDSPNYITPKNNIIKKEEHFTFNCKLVMLNDKIIIPRIKKDINQDKIRPTSAIQKDLELIQYKDLILYMEKIEKSISKINININMDKNNNKNTIDLKFSARKNSTIKQSSRKQSLNSNTDLDKNSKKEKKINSRNKSQSNYETFEKKLKQQKDKLNKQIYYYQTLIPEGKTTKNIININKKNDKIIRMSLNKPALQTFRNQSPKDYKSFAQKFKQQENSLSSRISHEKTMANINTKKNNNKTKITLNKPPLPIKILNEDIYK